MNRDGRRGTGRSGDSRGTGRPGDSRRSSGFAVPAPVLDSTQKNQGKQKQKQKNRQNNKYDKNQNDDFEKKMPKRGTKAPVKPGAKAAAPKPEPVVEEIKTIVIPEVLTIKELAAAADINRKTFYNYYSDIGGIIDEIEDELVAALENALRDVDLLHVLQNPYQLFSRLTAAISENLDFYILLFLILHKLI